MSKRVKKARKPLECKPMGLGHGHVAGRCDACGCWYGDERAKLSNRFGQVFYLCISCALVALDEFEKLPRSE